MDRPSPLPVVVVRGDGVAAVAGCQHFRGTPVVTSKP
jgi:hypothetical protein